MGDKYPGWSPYNYCLNNPVIFTDPDGRTVDLDEELVEEHENNMENDPEYAEAYNKLKKSSQHYVIRYVDKKNFKSKGDAQGVTTTDGTVIIIQILRKEGGQKLESRLSHEVEHARQFDDGEIGFASKDGVTWIAFNYDVYDEVKAYKASVRKLTKLDLSKSSNVPLLGYENKYRLGTEEMFVEYTKSQHSKLKDRELNNTENFGDFLPMYKKANYKLHYRPYKGTK